MVAEGRPQTAIHKGFWFREDINLREATMANYDGLLAESIRMQGHNGDEVDAYLARPLGAGPFPGVVLIHHMPGWDEASYRSHSQLCDSTTRLLPKDRIWKWQSEELQ